MVINPQDSLVSIISPVYNSEKFVGRMLESILAQTYTNIEMICVDDGSSDGTDLVIRSYERLFEAKGMKLVYTKQEHSGQTQAVNTALKLVNGEYLSWVDSDDYLTADSIEKKLIVLQGNLKFGIVTSNFFVTDEKLIVIERKGSTFGALNFQEHQFYLALAGMSIIESNCHLVKMSLFDNAFPNREIVPCKEGQNFQLMLPLYYKYKRAYIDEPLAYYVYRPESHYHQKRSGHELAERNNSLRLMIENVLRNLHFLEWEVRKLIASSCFAQYI